METLQPRRPRQNRVRGRAAASGAAGGRRTRSAGREWVSVPAAAAAVDGREMAAALIAGDAAGVRGSNRRGPSNAAEAKERGRDGQPPRVVATAGSVARRKRPTGRAATGWEHQASRREDDRGGNGRDGNFQGEGKRDGGASASGKRAAGASD